MTIFVVIIFIAFVNFIIQRKKQISILNIVLFTFMMLVCALRDFDVGTDTQTYLGIFDNPFKSDRFEAEFIFNYLIVYLKELGISATGVQTIMTLISFCGFYLLFKKASPNIALSILIFLIAVNLYYSESFNIVRQMVATPFLLLSYSYLNEKKYKRTIIFFIIAAGFHKTSWIYLPFITLASIYRFNYKIVVIAVISSLFVGIVAVSMTQLSNLLTLLMATYDLGGLNDYEYFATYKIDDVRNINGLLTMLLPSTFVCIYSYKRLGGNFYANMYFIGTVLLNFISAFPTAMRVCLGLTTLDLIIIPMMWVKSSSVKDKIILMCFIIVLLIFRIYTLATTSQSGIVPYSSFI